MESVHFMKTCSHSEPAENKKRPPAQETGGPDSSVYLFLRYESSQILKKKSDTDPPFL
jgi:hypothetical protein